MNFVRRLEIHKYVVAIGACAVSENFYRNYATVQGCDRIIPVDVYIPGCPPRSEMILFPPRLTILRDKGLSVKIPSRTSKFKHENSKT